MIRGAGGAVVREGDDGIEVLVVHRPRYDDWSFPKGKAHRGESDEECAVREVEEETGLRCELVRELRATSYLDGQGRRKRVRYWLMRPVEGAALSFEHEVDDAVWLPPAGARSLLSYERDRVLLDDISSAS